MTTLRSFALFISVSFVACSGSPTVDVPASDSSDFRNRHPHHHDMAMPADLAHGDMAVKTADMTVATDMGIKGDMAAKSDLAVKTDMATTSGGGGNGSLGGVTFPWPIFDNSVPDVAVSSTGKTWYVDANHGSDGNDGTTFATAKKTFNAALGLVNTGDTVLLAGGLYRERPNFGSKSGASGKPITIGSYGRGTGRPILDGGVKPGTWTKVSGTVWKTSTNIGKLASTPLLGIYVGSGSGEYALKEVAHGQLCKYGSDTLPLENASNVTDGSSKFYSDTSAKVVYADFGGTLGAGDPNAADISLLYDSENIGHEPLIVLGSGQSYISFVGLAMRAASWHALYSEGSNITFDHCDLKFNGGGGAFFDTLGSGERVTSTRIWMTVLYNWPRFNNGNCTGGWPGSLVFYAQSNSTAQGNVIYQNGGEGLIFYGTPSGHTSVNNHVKNNVIFDNFSVNLYFDNTQNATAEENFVFDHPRDASQTFDNLFTLSSGYNTDWGKRITPMNISLADEPFSSDDGAAHLANITVINNIFAGGKAGFNDYDDGTKSPTHGLKGCVIANNTWVLGTQAIPGQSAYVWRHNSSGDTSTGSLLQNNLFLTAATADHFVEALTSSGPGINDDYNFYGGPGAFLNGGSTLSFTAWRAAHTSWDAHSLNGDPALTSAVSEFSQTAAQKFVYDWTKATPPVGSPLIGKGTAQSFTIDFTGAARAGAYDIGAVTHH